MANFSSSQPCMTSDKTSLGYIPTCILLGVFLYLENGKLLKLGTWRMSWKNVMECHRFFSQKKRRNHEMCAKQAK